MFQAQEEVMKNKIVTEVAVANTIIAQIKVKKHVEVEVKVANHESKKIVVRDTIKSQTEAGKNRIIILNLNIKVATGVAEIDNFSFSSE